MDFNNGDSSSTLLRIRGFKPKAAFFKPGQLVQIGVELDCSNSTQAQLEANVWHLCEEVYRVESQIKLVEGRQVVEFTWNPPPEHPCGYGLEIQVKASINSLSTSASTAFDVLERWTEHPRYGFLCEFAQDRGDIEDTIARLAAYHINGLQFYDWMYRHEQFLSQEEPYLDILGRKLSRRTVDRLIDEAHKYNVAAMAYSSVYGCSLAFQRNHSEWSLFDEQQRPILFGENFMAIMDSSPDSPWTAHLLDQFSEVLQYSRFDGIHLDQYGEPKYGWSVKGKHVDIGDAVTEMIYATRNRVDAHRANGAVVFNLVNNWPVERAAVSPQSFIYIEVWPPHDTYADLYELVINAQKLSSGKPVVIALYIEGSYAKNLLLADSILFASGASRIELGEEREGLPGLLSDPYFPKYSKLNPQSAGDLARLYDFAVRYQEVTGPATRPVNEDVSVIVYLDNMPLRCGVKDTVWPILRQGDKFLAVNLINLSGVETIAWKEQLRNPPIKKIKPAVRINGVSNPVKRVWVASPDTVDLSAKILPFYRVGDTLTFDLPDLERWALVVVEWSGSE